MGSCGFVANGGIVASHSEACCSASPGVRTARDTDAQSAWPAPGCQRSRRLGCSSGTFPLSASSLVPAVTWNRSGTTYDIYYDSGPTSGTPFDSGASGPWINCEALTITCPADFQNIKELWREMTDLVYGRPIMMNTENLDAFTSEQEADRLRKLLNSTSVEQDVTCADATTVKYIMTPETANGMQFSPTTYLRLAEKIALRYSISLADARQWIWLGRLDEFIGFVYQIRPEVRRLNLSAEEQSRRIVARYDSHSKGYAYIKDPMKGIILTGGASDSE